MVKCFYERIHSQECVIIYLGSPPLPTSRGARSLTNIGVILDTDYML